MANGHNTNSVALCWRRLRVHKQTQSLLYLIDLRLNTGTAEYSAWTNASFSSCSGDSPDLLFLSRRPDTLGGMDRRDEDRC